jgi:hypothetical protein
MKVQLPHLLQPLFRISSQPLCFGMQDYDFVRGSRPSSETGILAVY